MKMATSMGFVSSFCSRLHSFAVTADVFTRWVHTANGPLRFQLSPMLSAEPMKKRKKVDAAIEKLREDRRKRRLEKEIRRLEKVGRKLKPIDEMEVPPRLLNERKLRLRKVPPPSEEEWDHRSRVLKEWTLFKHQQNKAETAMVARMMEAQAHALQQLKIVSEDLYEQALQPDPLFVIGFKAVGPVYTPPVEGHVGLDGEYTDVTKKWD